MGDMSLLVKPKRRGQGATYSVSVIVGKGKRSGFRILKAEIQRVAAATSETRQPGTKALTDNLELNSTTSGLRCGSAVQTKTMSIITIMAVGESLFAMSGPISSAFTNGRWPMVIRRVTASIALTITETTNRITADG
ncbi:hypothetical protein ACFO8Q_15295 [Effusibacillus consociatus]|uniref:Transposase n=2 Tax=Effusibacillus consociatus TaxID=1117041 RepID=A0ABV9Q350_9BACL